MRRTVFVTNLSILTAATDSNALSVAELEDAESITIFAPAVLPEAVKVQIANNKAPAAGDWRDLDEGAGDIVIGAGQARTLDFLSFQSLRLQAGAGVAADRVFNVNKTFVT